MDFQVSSTYCVLCKYSKVYVEQKIMPVRQDLRTTYGRCNYSAQTLAVAENSTEAKHQINFTDATVLAIMTGYRERLMEKASEIQLHCRKSKRDLEFTVSHSNCLPTIFLQLGRAS
jgi:hypothetical protein